MKQNFPGFISLVWPPNGDFDSPLQGYHVTAGDPGLGTKGGVIQATWTVDVAKGIVTGTLAQATDAQLEAVLDVEAWGPVCDALPAGLDVLVANGRMMTGAYPRLLQQCLGFTGDDVDGDLGPDTLGDAAECDAKTLINALHGRHYAYLASLPTWGEFRGGWTRRLVAVHARALALAEPL